MRTARAVSAGGLVLAEPVPDAMVALVARRSHRGQLQWTLPKGTQEPGESVADTALRETREETGLDVEMIGRLDVIDYWFVWSGPGATAEAPSSDEPTRYHKFVHYFLMLAVGGDLARHDREMERAEWFAPAAAREALAFDNERRLLDLVPGALGGRGAGSG